MGILARSFTVSRSRIWRILKWTCIKYCYAILRRPRSPSPFLDDRPLLGPFEKPQARILSVVTGDMPFPADEALHGTVATPALCARIPSGLWIEAEGRGECIRYYAHGLKDKNPQVLVYFGGDVLLTASQGVRHIAASYRSQCPARIEADMAEWSRQAHAPALFIGRPGLHGSSGDHHMRRQPREITLMDQALDALKRRHEVGSFILAGQSGGGLIVAALLSRREDVGAAVMASSLLSVRRTAALWEYRRDIPARFLHDSGLFYDPVEDIERIARPPSGIYVISDPEDSVVPFATQLHYVRSLRAARLEPHHIFAHAPAPAHHVLSGHAQRAAALIARGATPKAIRAELNALDWNHVHQENKTPSPRSFQRSEVPAIDAQSAVSLTIATDAGLEHERLFEKAPALRSPPASLTKLMTAAVMLDLMPRFGLSLTDHLDIMEADIDGGSGANVKPGETIIFSDALANLMLPSSNITANAIARTLGQLMLDADEHARHDPRRRFVDEMNAKSAQLGMHDTRFNNPSGQSADGQLTTAADIAKLMVAAIEYPEILEHWGKPSHIMRVLGPHARDQKIHSTVKILKDYDVMGGKTGTLLPGCHNVAIVSEAPNGERIVSVVLHASSQEALYRDLRRIVDAIKRGRDWLPRNESPIQDRAIATRFLGPTGGGQ